MVNIASEKWPEAHTQYLAYVQTVTVMFEQINNPKNNAAILAASIRQLIRYPQYRDLSLLLLEEVNVNGHNKFEEMLRAELKKAETQLLGMQS